MSKKQKNLQEEESKCYVRWVESLSKSNLIDLVLRLKKELEYEYENTGILKNSMITTLEKSEEHFRKRPFGTFALRIPSDFIIKNKKGVYP